MNEVSAQPEPTNSPSNGSSLRIVKWLVSTFGGAVALTILSGSATPRVRLLFLAPLTIGAFTAVGAIWLLIKFDLNHDMKNWMVGWITLLAIGVTFGTTALAYKNWKDSLKSQRAALMRQINTMAENAEDPEVFQQERRAMMLAFQEKTSFTAYLSYRLQSFARQMGRRTVWAPPIPELILLGEQFLSGVAALFLSINAYNHEKKLHHEEQTA